MRGGGIIREWERIPRDGRDEEACIELTWYHSGSLCVLHLLRVHRGMLSRRRRLLLLLKGLLHEVHD